MKITIEKGISFKKDNIELPFDEMEVGDSFLIPKEMIHTTVRVRAIQYSNLQKVKPKFSIKKTEQGYRCWRII